MAGLPKSIIKKYGMTKKAWAVFRGKGGGKKAAKRRRAKPKKHTARARPKRARAKRTRTPAGETQHGGKKMAKRRKGIRRRARRAFRRVSVAMESRPGKVLTMAVMAAAGGVGTSVIVNNAPVLKDQGKTVKSAIQGGLGLAAILFVKNRQVKSLGAGAVIAGVMGLAKDLFKVEPLAGPSAGSVTLTPSEMAQITRGQTMAIPLPSGRMGVPMSTAPANAGWGKGGFGN
jgi:hypothetical protein